MKILPDVNDIKNMKKNMIEALNKSVKIWDNKKASWR
jgi:hypothetical protein